jgi:hypothetical protein
MDANSRDWVQQKSIDRVVPGLNEVLCEQSFADVADLVCLYSVRELMSYSKHKASFQQRNKSLDTEAIVKLFFYLK